MTSEEKKDQERPLVTFALFAYNHEQFIREAVEGAFSQTYRPLEIILSDDCSTDRTFEIMQEMAAEYDGPHTVILNRNKKNLGIGGHVNRMMEIESGELVVVAAGDDISLSERTYEIFKAWEASNRNAFSLYSSVAIIDKHSRWRGLYRSVPSSKAHDLFFMVDNFCPYVIGASHAWCREIYDRFGPILEETVCEDRVLPFRSILLGRIVYIDKPLVEYRRHDRNVSFARRTKRPILNLHKLPESSLMDRILSVHNYINDVKTLNCDNEKLLGHLQSRLYFLELHYAMITLSFTGRLKALIEAAQKNVDFLSLWILAMKYLIPVPYNIYCLLRYGGKRDSWDKYLSEEASLD